MTENSYLPKKLHLQINTLKVHQKSIFLFLASSAPFGLWFEFSDMFQGSYFRPVVRCLDIAIDMHSFWGTFVASSVFSSFFKTVANSNLAAVVISSGCLKSKFGFQIEMFWCGISIREFQGVDLDLTGGEHRASLLGASAFLYP